MSLSYNQSVLIDCSMSKAESKNGTSWTNKLPQPPGLSAFDEERISQMSNQGISREKAVELIKEHG